MAGQGSPMNNRKGFTLLELLAVIGIMLVLMTATIGVLSTFAEQTGPDSTVTAMQSFLNTGRDYAAANGVVTRICFTSSSTNVDSSIVKLQYMPAGMTGWSDTNALDVPGLRPLVLHDQLIILKDIPAFAPLSSTNTSAVTIGDADVDARRRSEQIFLETLSTFANTSMPAGSGCTQSFYIEIDPAGYLRPNTTNDAAMVGTGLTVVKLVGQKVTAYAFFPLNMNTGTRLVFQ
jgi:prepilin-type N-terminal cleavage/methylation domain-containing protein